MVCSACGRAAVFRVTDAGETEAYCATCLRLATGDEGLALVLGAFLRAPTSPDVCVHCGCRKEEWKATGLLGCPLCYEVFLADLPHHFGLPEPSAPG